MDRQPSVVHMVGLVIKFLNDLRVEHTDKIGQRGIVIGNDGKDRRFLFPQFADAHIVVVGDRADLIHIECRQPYRQRDIDALCRFACRLLVDPILLYSNVHGLIVAELLEQQIERRHIRFLVFAHIGVGEHLHDHAEVLLFLRRFVQEIEHERFEQRCFRFFPERIATAAAFRRGIAD